MSMRLGGTYPYVILPPVLVYEQKMTNIAAALKAEIARLAKKALKQDLASVRSASAMQRKQIAALKVQLLELQRTVMHLQRARPSKELTVKSEKIDASAPRFSAKGLRFHRQKLGLSAQDYALLAGVSPLSIYKWEAEKARPRRAQLSALAGVRELGKRAAANRLKELKAC